MNKTLFVISILFLTLIPVGFQFEATFRNEWYGILGLGLVFPGFIVGVILLVTSFGIYPTYKNYDKEYE